MYSRLRRGEDRRARPGLDHPAGCSTTRSSHSMRTTLRSWLTNSRPIPSSRRSRSSNCRMTACTETSSAAVGSSSTSRRGPRRDGAGDADARLLAARELVREALQQLRRQPGARRPRRAPAGSSAAPSRIRSSRRSGCAMLSNAVWRGLRLSCGSWNTIWMSRRRGERWNSRDGIAADRLRRRRRCRRRSGSISRQIRRESVLLPEPALAHQAQAAARRETERDVVHRAHGPSKV